MTAIVPSPPESKSSSRRAILAGALGGLGAWAAAAVARVSPTRAAAGSALIVGSLANNAGTSNTILSTSSTVVAFELMQNGQGTALMGYATAASGGTRGVYGRTDSPNGDGVQARNAGALGSGAAVRAFGGNNRGVEATSNGNIAILGTSTNSWGVGGVSTNGTAVVGNSTSYIGVYGTSSSYYGVVAASTSGTAIYGVSSGNLAGLFAGNVQVNGTLSKTAGGFKIDHPLDPANQYLQHSFVESPDMKNVYDGVMTLDTGGEATVELPTYFEALNRDTRIQLTAVGAFSPLYVKSKVAGGSFTIAGGTPSQEVYWQVTGIRQDAFAEAHRIVVEEAKNATEQGKYLHPELYGQPASKAMHKLPEDAGPAVPKG